MSNSNLSAFFLNFTFLGGYSYAKTILIAENTEYEIEDTYILKSPYIQSIKKKVGDHEVNSFVGVGNNTKFRTTRP